MAESTQHKLSRVRPPRVQITYDVETGGAATKKELPFIVGCFAPLSGKSERKLPPISQRKMVEIDRDNFDKVMESIAPKVAFSVPRTLSGAGDLQVNITFNSINDFGPKEVLLQVGDLAKLYSERSRLRDFLAKLDGNDSLMNIILEILADEDRVSKLKSIIAESHDRILEARAITETKNRNEAVLAAIPEEGRAEGTDINRMLMAGKMVLESSQIPYALELVAEFTMQVLVQDDLLPARGNEVNVAAMVSRRISQKDQLISRQLNHVLHHHEFQALEATWRGLHYLVMKSETGAKLKIKVLNTTFDDLYKDLDKAVEFDQSGLFKIIYENEYGTFGGNPYSLLIGDFQIGRSPRDIAFLEKMSNLAAAAHAPFIASAYSKLFDLEDFDGLHKPRDLTKLFESSELAKWRSFRESEDSRYVTLTLPKVMLRLPYHHEKNPVDGIDFDEVVAVSVYEVDEAGSINTDSQGRPVVVTQVNANGIAVEQTRKSVDANKLLWGNPAFTLGAVITNAFAKYGWTAAIRGVEGGGIVDELPAYTYETEDGDVTLTCPTQVSITDRREKELNDLGFMALCHCKGTDKAVFFGGQTTNKAKSYMTDSASKNAQVSSMLPYMLASSRFAHYIKIMMRERLGSFMTAQNVEDYLNGWIKQYVLLDDTATQALKARFPLREARVSVTEMAGKVGSYRATVFLRPHFQLEELTASIRLVADLPA
jgi:type VI secretion system protein ImpC